MKPHLVPKKITDRKGRVTTVWVRMNSDFDIPRSKMPQIRSEKFDAFRKYLEKKGVSMSDAEVPASELKPTQKHLDHKKVELTRHMSAEYANSKRVLTSQDGYILDGHHRWAGAMRDGTNVPVRRISMEMVKLLPLVRKFPGVEYASLTHMTDTAKQASAKVDSIEKAKDYSKLVKKRITNSRGVATTVYVDPTDNKEIQSDGKQSDGSDKQKAKSFESAKNPKRHGNHRLPLTMHVGFKDLTHKKYKPQEDEWGGHWAARILSMPTETKVGDLLKVGDRRIPVSVYEEVKKWPIATISPYSYSFYDIPDKSWNYTAEGSHRIADHWNFTSQGKKHAETTEDVPDDGMFRLAVYEKGKYRILKELGKADGDKVEKGVYEMDYGW